MVLLNLTIIDEVKIKNTNSLLNKNADDLNNFLEH